MVSLSDVASLLACPVCSGALTLRARVLACAHAHAFDVARRGYVNLLGSAPPKNADTTEMVAARERFLAGGHYAPIAEAIARRTGGVEAMLEVGAGTGYYLAKALDARPSAVGIASDVSLAASRRAARAHDRIGAIVADTWAGLPVRSGRLDAVMCVFAPRNPQEFARVLRPGGALIVVTPDEAHLANLRASHGLLDVPSGKLTGVRRSMVDFDPVATQLLTYDLRLCADEVADLVGMGPNAFHNPGDCYESIRTMVSVHVSVFRRPER